MPERRPRIPDDLAERIDRIRGDVPFERWVRRHLDMAVLQAERVAGVLTQAQYDEAVQDRAIDMIRQRKAPW